jgi:hypothetical protein
MINNVKTGNMLLCTSCGNGVVSYLRSGNMAAAGFPESLFGSKPGDSDEVSVTKQIRIGNIAGIEARCKFHKLSPNAAEAKARELAVAYWSNPMDGALAAMKFWDPEANGEAEQMTARLEQFAQMLGGLSGKTAKRWWQFWK